MNGIINTRKFRTSYLFVCQQELFIDVVKGWLVSNASCRILVAQMWGWNLDVPLDAVSRFMGPRRHNLPICYAAGVLCRVILCLYACLHAHKNRIEFTWLRCNVAPGPDRARCFVCAIPVLFPAPFVCLFVYCFLILIVFSPATSKSRRCTIYHQQLRLCLFILGRRARLHFQSATMHPFRG